MEMQLPKKQRCWWLTVDWRTWSPENFLPSSIFTPHALFEYLLVLWSASSSGMCAKLHTVAASNNRVHMPWSLYYCLFAPRIYIVVLRAHPVRGESYNQRNATGEVATPVSNWLTAMVFNLFFTTPRICSLFQEPLIYDVTTLDVDVTRGKKQVWLSHVRDWGLSKGNVAYCAEGSSLLVTLLGICGVPRSHSAPPQWFGAPIVARRPGNCASHAPLVTPLCWSI